MYGVPSGSARIVVTEDMALVDYICDAESFSPTTRDDQAVPLKTGALVVGSNAPNYAGRACRLSGPSDKTCVQSNADSDGLEATAWTAHRDMRNTFIVPVTVQHMAIVCDDDVTIRFYRRGRFGPETLATMAATSKHKAANSAPGPFVTKIYVDQDDANSVKLLQAGIVIKTTVACTIFADGVTDGDEFTLFGHDT